MLLYCRVFPPYPVCMTGKFGSKGGAMAPAAVDEDRDKLVESYLREMSMATNLNTPGLSREALEETGEGDEEEEEDGADLPGEDQINEMMAHSEAELQIYRQIDEERAARRALLPTHPPPPLMIGEETPHWLQPHHWTSKNTLLLDALTKDSADKVSKKTGVYIDTTAADLAEQAKGRKRKEVCIYCIVQYILFIIYIP